MYFILEMHTLIRYATITFAHQPWNILSWRKAEFRTFITLVQHELKFIFLNLNLLYMYTNFAYFYNWVTDYIYIYFQFIEKRYREESAKGKFYRRHYVWLKSNFKGR